MADESPLEGPPRNILLATDLSARCDRALDRAVSLASHSGGRLVAVHVLERQDDDDDVELERRLPSWRRGSDRAPLVEEQLRRDMRQACENLTVVVEQGNPAEVILRVAEEHDCDVIVAGVARDETLGRFGLGATVNRLVRRSSAPVLVVKQRVSGPYKRIVVATDFSDSSLHAARTAARFFPHEEVSVFHAYEAPIADMTGDGAQFQASYRAALTSECAKFLDASGLSEGRPQGVQLLLEPGRPARLLRDYVRHEGIELVVLGSHGRSAIFDVLIGSTTTDILSSAPCDVLVVRAPQAAG